MFKIYHSGSEVFSLENYHVDFLRPTLAFTVSFNYVGLSINVDFI